MLGHLKNKRAAWHHHPWCFPHELQVQSTEYYDRHTGGALFVRRTGGPGRTPAVAEQWGSGTLGREGSRIGGKPFLGRDFRVCTCLLPLFSLSSWI